MTIQRLIFVRHGESRHHVDGLTGGWTDTSLTDRGRRQVAATARHLAELDLSGVGFFTSDLKRASETAEIIGGEIGRTPTALGALREINIGDATDMTLSDAEKIRRPQPESIDLDWAGFNGGETLRALNIRMRAALDQLKDSGHREILVVGHGFSGTMLLKAWLGLPVLPYIAFNLAPASVSELLVNEFSEPCIERLNSQYGEMFVGSETS